MQKSESDKRRFLASIQGVNLEGDGEEKEGPSFEDVQRRAMGITASGNDIVSLQGQFAAQAGFGIGAGLGYERG